MFNHKDEDKKSNKNVVYKSDINNLVFNRNNASKYKVRGLKNEFFGDLYHTFLSNSWFYVLLTIFLSSMVVNLIFTSLYITCDGIKNASHLYDYFFFSIQTLSTIGYGFMYPTNLCSHILVSAQSFLGMVFVSFLTGIVFSKFSIPRSKIIYTKNMVIHHEDESLVAKIRMVNQRNNQIIDANVNAVVLKLEQKSDGSSFRRIHDLKLVRDRIPIFSLSFTLQHIIDETSPLFGETHESLIKKQVIIILTISGTDESITQNVISKHIYSFEDIKWGMKFKDVITHNENEEIYFDYDNFDELIEEKTTYKMSI